MIYIGIDPGKSGGIAWRSGGRSAVEKMPDTDRDLYDLIQSITFEAPRGRVHQECIAYLEQVHSSPQMGVKSAFTFGEGFGKLQMVLTALDVPYKRVRPQEWQKAMKCMTKGDKNVSKRRAQELFPYLKVTHATADALLIAEYARMTETGREGK